MSYHVGPLQEQGLLTVGPSLQPLFYFKPSILHLLFVGLGVLQQVCGGQRTIRKSCFSPFFMYILKFELRYGTKSLYQPSHLSGPQLFSQNPQILAQPGLSRLYAFSSIII